MCRETHVLRKDHFFKTTGLLVSHHISENFDFHATKDFLVGLIYDICQSLSSYYGAGYHVTIRASPPVLSKLLRF